MIDTILNKITKLVNKAEVYFIEEDIIPIKFKNGNLDRIFTKNTTGISLIVINQENRLGIAYSTNLNEPQRLIEDVINSAKFGEKINIDFPSNQDYQKVNIYDDKVVSLSIEDMVKAGKEIIDKTINKYPGLQVDVNITKKIKKVKIFNTSGLRAEYKSTPYSIFLSTPIPNSSGSIYKYQSLCKYFEFPDYLIDELIRDYKLCKNNFTVQTKKMPVIFTPNSIDSLLYRFMVGISGETLDKGISPLDNKIDEKIFSEKITIIDDPTIDYETGSVPFDDEGIATNKKYLVKDGVLKTFIFDLQTGARTGNKTTGNGFKRVFFSGDLTTLITPNTTNMVLQTGDMSTDDMISDMKEGLIIDSVLGMHCGNIAQGEYSVNIGLGFLVKNGEVQGRVINAMTSGNIYKDFQNIISIGNELRPNFLGLSPHLYCSDISITGKN